MSNRTRDLNEEDANSMTILVHQLFSENYKMASKLMVRGAQIDYVNRNGNTALHICIENNRKEAVKFLLSKGANPHIMDLDGQDACDKAKMNNMAVEIPRFNNCNIKKKIIPLLPHGEYADISQIPAFQKQQALKKELSNIDL